MISQKQRIIQFIESDNNQRALQSKQFRLNQMSLYNGFVSHQQQQKYYNLIKYLVLVLQKRLLRFYQSRPCNEYKFASILGKLKHKIAKIQNSKYNQPKFADSLNDLLGQLRPQYASQSKRISSLSDISLNINDNKSSFSFDTFHQNLPRASKIYTRPDLQESVNIKQRRNYRSFQSMKTTPIINQIQEWQSGSVSRSSRQPPNQFKSLKLRLHPPRLGQYIQKIKRQTKLIDVYSKKGGRQQSGQPYLGQRRKKVKRNVRGITNQ